MVGGFGGYSANQEMKRNRVGSDIETLRKRFVVKYLRKASLYWPYRYAALKASRVERGKYRCAGCKKTFKARELQLDHIEPVVELKGWNTIEAYVERLLCDSKNFQPLCKGCHEKKTTKENKERSQ